MRLIFFFGGGLVDLHNDIFFGQHLEDDVNVSVHRTASHKVIHVASCTENERERERKRSKGRNRETKGSVSG